MIADNDAGNTVCWELRWHTALASDMVQYKYINTRTHTNNLLISDGSL